MKWNNLTGLEAETEDERKMIRKSMWQFASMMGRSSVVMLLGFAIAIGVTALPEPKRTEITEAMLIETSLGTISAVDFLFIPAFVWALAPAAFSLYRLWRLRGFAKRGVTIGENSPGVWNE